MSFEVSPDAYQVLIAIQAFSCFFMTGLIWMVQLVHYPGFAYIEKNRFAEFHLFHSKKITYIVLPVMAFELVTAFILCLSWDQIFIWNFISVIVLWLLTGLVSVPIHSSLSAKMDLKKIRRLVMTNWFRTATWTFRSAAILYFIITRR